jgi:CheY-like chemotaxis protein
VDAPQKLAFVVQANRLQGLIWQALLKSQKLAIILEPANRDLADCLSQIASAGLTLPDVIVLDAEAAELNPYEFCRWCREAFPQIQVFLTRCRQLHVSDTERRWAQQQGATDFLSGFERDSLMSSATVNVKHILTSLDYPFLNEKALLTVLLNIRRQLGATQSTAAAPPKAQRQGQKNRPGGLTIAATAKPAAELADSPDKAATPDPLNDLEWVTSGLRSLSDALTGTSRMTTVTPPPTPKTSALPAAPAEEKLADGAAVRRYRGVVY